MENKEAAGRLEVLGEKIWNASRDELYLGMRFLDVALNSFVYQMDTQVSPFGTDGAVLYFHPQQLGGLYRQNRILVNRGYLHMVYHCIFRHMWKEYPAGPEDDFPEEKRQGMDPGARLWNLSCDIAAEYLIDRNYHRSVRYSRSLLRRETYRKLEQEGKTLHAERIFKLLRGWNPDEKGLAKLEQEFYADDHQYWASHQPDRKPDADSCLQKKWQDIDEQMETDLETFSKEASEQNGDLLGQLKIENREKHDYRSFLKKFSVWREELGVDTDTFDYTFYSYGLSLYGNMPLIEPQETKEVKKVEEFAVVVDTSMSCSGELVRRFLEETYDVLSENESFFRKINVHIIQCDETVRSDVKISGEKELREYMDNLTLYGEGGTDFRPAFDYVDEKIRQGEFTDLRGLIYFTDGYGIYPRKAPGYQTAFVFMQEDYQDADVPGWAMKLTVD
ncbi:metallopeptidase [Lachnospiraceae bacterium]|jgi:predicted metal-dependent peptidase|nr:VWA-like domain-containing protein [uncultured Schaedlerella sp.]EOS36214.1 hypothetical protein C808_04095 [Lachnospiraceae bacterium M18-1]MCI9153867.1 metallopeptidase [Ruminococcus sp.]NBI59646.1 metallopeptidase [Lachnospiraceae bacterium]